MPTLDSTDSFDVRVRKRVVVCYRMSITLCATTLPVGLDAVAGLAAQIIGDSRDDLSEQPLHHLQFTVQVPANEHRG